MLSTALIQVWNFATYTVPARSGLIFDSESSFPTIAEDMDACCTEVLVEPCNAELGLELGHRNMLHSSLDDLGPDINDPHGALFGKVFPERHAERGPDLGRRNMLYSNLNGLGLDLNALAVSARYFHIDQTRFTVTCCVVLIESRTFHVT